MGAWRRLLPLVRQEVRRCGEFSLKRSDATWLSSQRSVASEVERGISVWREQWSIQGGVRKEIFVAGNLLQFRAGLWTAGHALQSTESLEPGRSPLSQAPGPVEETKTLATQKFAKAVLSDVRISAKKVNLVAALVRGMRCSDALMQMQVLPKRAAKIVYKVVHSARANAIQNHGLDKDRLVVSEAFVGKGTPLKRVMPHAKGRRGLLRHPHCQLTVILKEMSAEQEAELAKVRLMKKDFFRTVKSKLSPHQIRESKWERFQAGRKAEGRSRLPPSFSRPKPGLPPLATVTS